MPAPRLWDVLLDLPVTELLSPKPFALIEPIEVLSGAGFGLRQSLVRGVVRVCLPPGANVAGVLAVVDAAVGADAFSDPHRPLDSSTSLALVAGWLAAVSRVQRCARIPVFEDGRIVAQSVARGGEQGLRFVSPWVHADATTRSLRDLARLFHMLLGLPAQALARQGPGMAAECLENIERFIGGAGVKGNNTFRFLREAHQLDIAFRPLVDNIFVLGHGRHARWLDSSFTDRTSALGANMARHKRMGAQVLRDAGLPVPEHRLASDAEQAVKIANALGYPVVVKPEDKDGGKGVTADIRGEGDVTPAYAEARRHSSRVLVERHVHGDDFRLTVAHGRMIKAVRRVPGGVTGDGTHDVESLISIANADPKRAQRNADRGAMLLSLDDEARTMLAALGLSAVSVPAAGEYIALRRRANVSTGGEPLLVTDQVHPDNRRLAERAARALRLDIAGVDLIIADISKSWIEIGAAICEVNAQPQIGEGTTPGIYADLLRELLPVDSRIPVMLVLGQTDAAGRALQMHLRANGILAGFASRAGGWDAQGHCVSPGPDCFEATRTVMSLPEAAAVVVVARPGDLVNRGLPVDRIKALVWADWADAGGADPASLDQMLAMLSPHVVGPIAIHADDPAFGVVVQAASRTKIVAVSASPVSQALQAHRDAGGRALWVERGQGPAGEPVSRVMSGGAVPSCLQAVAGTPERAALIRGLLAIAAHAHRGAAKTPGPNSAQAVTR